MQVSFQSFGSSECHIQITEFKYYFNSLCLLLSFFPPLKSYSIWNKCSISSILAAKWWYLSDKVSLKIQMKACSFTLTPLSNCWDYKKNSINSDKILKLFPNPITRCKNNLNKNNIKKHYINYPQRSQAFIHTSTHQACYSFTPTLPKILKISLLQLQFIVSAPRLLALKLILWALELIRRVRWNSHSSLVLYPILG